MKVESVNLRAFFRTFLRGCTQSVGIANGAEAAIVATAHRSLEPEQMRRFPKLSPPGPRPGSLLERRLEALEIRFPAPPPVNIADNIIGLALRHVPTEDFQLLIPLAKESAAGTPREMSVAETKAHDAFEAALKLECRRAGIGSLQEFERLLDADRGNRRTGRAGNWR